MRENPGLTSVVEYILNRATAADLEVIAAALERRGNATAGAMNFQSMASGITRGFADRFKMPDNINQITRNMVKSMIRQHEPNIPEDHLEALLDKWVPGQEKLREGQVERYPPEVVYSMAEQFFQYGIGSMPDKELQELKKLMPDWHEKYWNIFSPVIRNMLAEAIRGQMNLQEFRAKLRTYLRLA